MSANPVETIGMDEELAEVISMEQDNVSLLDSMLSVLPRRGTLAIGESS